MIDYKTLHEHLDRTGRLKLLPKILRDLKEREVKAKLRAPRIEKANNHPELISGERRVENGVLMDTTGKRALLEIYQSIIR